MPRRKPVPASESDARLAFGVAAGWSALACCRFSGQPQIHRQAAHARIAERLADPSFSARVTFFREQITRDEMDTRAVQEQVRSLNRDWVLYQLKKIYQTAMGDSPVGIDETGQEQFLPTPHLATAVRALGEMAKVLRLAEAPAEYDEDIERVLAEVREGRKAVN